MNVTLATLMRGGFAVCCLAAWAGCSDARVSLETEIPEPYGTAVAELSLRVLLPPMANPFDCDQVALDVVDTATLDLSTIQRVVTQAQGGLTLAPVPRTGRKLFLLEAFDASGLPIVAGCAEVGEVDGDLSLRIEGEPVPVIDTEDHVFDQPLPTALAIRLTDQFGRPMTSFFVEWEVAGPAGESRPGTVMTDTDGRATITPEAPFLAGPRALDIRARWLRDRAPSLAGFVQPEPLYQLSVPEGDGERITELTRTIAQVGRLGPAGEPGIAFLSQQLGNDTRSLRVSYFDGGQIVERTRVVDSRIRAIGVLPLDGTRDQVVAALPGEWLRFSIVGAALSLSTQAAPGLPLLYRIFSLENCKGENGSLLIAQGFTTTTLVLDDGIRQQDHPLDGLTIERILLHSGCAGSPGGSIHRVLVATADGDKATLIADVDGFRTTTIAANAGSIGFAPGLGTEQPVLLAERTDGTGTSLGRYLVDPNGLDRLDTELVTEDPLLFFPLSAAGGDLDGDGEVDVAALNFAGLSAGLLGFRFFASLGTMHRGERLSGSGPPARAANPQLYVVDMNADGRDDVVIATPTSITVVLL